MKRKLTMDDVRIGMYITVLKGKMEQKVFPTSNGPEVIYREKDHYNGRILEVLNVDLPYIVIAIHDNLGSRSDTLDLRYIDVMRLDPDYIHKLVPRLRIHKDVFWEGIKNVFIESADADIEKIFKSLKK